MIKRRQFHSSGGASPKMFFVKGGGGFLFLPGLVLVLIGVLAVLAPKFFVSLVAAFFVFIGVFLSFLTWKFLRFKRKVEDLAKQFEGNIQVRGVRFQEGDFGSDLEVEEEEVKKVILH